MRTRGFVVGALACLALAACGDTTRGSTGGEPFRLPVGPTKWDTSAPAWVDGGALHVGNRMVELGDGVDLFVLGATGAYWVRGETLMFTSAEGETGEVADVGWANLAVSADHSVMATVDQSRGPTDEFGTHVLQVAAFDTRTGEQLYRTPDEEPDDDADLTDLYSELMPVLRGVSEERIFIDGATIRLDDGSSESVGHDAQGMEVHEGYAETLFPDGYHVNLRGEGRRRKIGESSAYGTGLLSPDRSTIFDNGSWPTPAVAYDAVTGLPRPIDAPWEHFRLAGWSDDDTFFGVAERIDDRPAGGLRARQVVSCELSTLACTPTSPVLSTAVDDSGQPQVFLIEGRPTLL